MDFLKERFNKVFANLPLPERENVIYVDKKYGPMSWYVVKLEVNAGTDVSKTVLKVLASLELI